jgi:FlaA1/EpsC-like NDP-sugar epimerase
VIPFFYSLRDAEELPITDLRMTRFMITLDQGVELVWHALDDMVGGEIYVKKIPSMKVTEMAKAIAPQACHKVVGIRPGEKLHEQMVGLEDAPFTYAYEGYYKILPAIHNWSASEERIKEGTQVGADFVYSSDSNTEWMPPESLQAWISTHQDQLGI